MSFDIEDKDVEIDLNNLIDLNLTFGPLQLTLQNIMKRLSGLEDENRKKTEEIEALNDALEELRKNQEEMMEEAKKKEEAEQALSAEEGKDQVEALHGEEEGGDGTEGGEHRHDGRDGDNGMCNEDEHAAMWDEIERLRDLLGEVADLNKDRDTIDEIFAARKSRRSVDETEQSDSNAQGGRRESVHGSEGTMGDKILYKAREQLPGLKDGSGTPVTPFAKGPSMSEGGAGESMEPSGPGSKPSSATHPLHSSDYKPNDRQSFRRGSRSLQHSAGARPSMTVVDKLSKDNSDIAYLNRVVAEILAEMKGLHEDVDLLRTYADSSSLGMQTGTDGEEAGGAQNQLANLLKRLRRVEGRVEEVNNGSQLRDDNLQSQIDDLKNSLKAASRLTEEDVDNVRRIADIMDRLKELENRVNGVEKANERTEEKLNSVLGLDNLQDATDINVGQFAALAGNVNALEKQLAELLGKGEQKDWSNEIERLQNELRRLQEDSAKLEEAVDKQEKESRRLDEVKADRSSTDGSDNNNNNNNSNLNNNNNMSGMEGSPKMTGGETYGGMNEILGRINRLEDDKADRAALQRLREEFMNMKRLNDINAQRDPANRDGSGNNNDINEQLLRELEQQLLSHQEASNMERDAAKEDLDGLRDLIDQLDRRKADATLVANKAERDYVENALERLMREVEQVLNATNAGLIDTLDKSLNILRDMIDGKASKQDINRLQQAISEEGGNGGSAADGLTGFKGFRCLGCNRPMDTMRPRNTASKMDPFLNRNAPNLQQDNVTRSIQQQQQASESRRIQQSNPNMRPSETSSARGVEPPLPSIEGHM